MSIFEPYFKSMGIFNSGAGWVPSSSQAITLRKNIVFNTAFLRLIATITVPDASVRTMKPAGILGIIKKLSFVANETVDMYTNTGLGLAVFNDVDFGAPILGTTVDGTVTATYSFHVPISFMSAGTAGMERASLDTRWIEKVEGKIVYGTVDDIFVDALGATIDVTSAFLTGEGQRDWQPGVLTDAAANAARKECRIIDYREQAYTLNQTEVIATLQKNKNRLVRRVIVVPTVDGAYDASLITSNLSYKIGDNTPVTFTNSLSAQRRVSYNRIDASPSHFEVDFLTPGTMGVMLDQSKLSDDVEVKVKVAPQDGKECKLHIFTETNRRPNIT